MWGSRLRRALESPRVPLVAALVAFALASPSLFSGLATEDWVQKALAGRPLDGGIDYFATLRSAQDVRGAQAHGLVPWLASPELRLSFFRPLASLWVLFDHRFLGGSPFLMHLESVALYALLAHSVARLFRRVLPVAWLAGLAALLFAVDDAHGHAVGWIANRSVLLAATFGVGAVHCHDRWRSEGSRRHGVLAPLLLALALASNELGLGALAYLVAHALFLDRTPRRLLGLTPSLAVALGWTLLYQRLGYGASGSGIYLDPIGAPGAYLSELPSRAGAMLTGLFAGPAADAWVRLGDRMHAPLAIAGFSAFALVLVASSPGDERRRITHFSAFGLALALLPAAASSPSDRSSFFPSLGGALLVAELLGLAVERRALWRRALALLAAGVHVVVAPALLPWRSLTMSRIHERALRASESAYASVIAGDELVVALNAPDYYFCSLLRMLRKEVGHGPAPALVCLSAGRGAVELRRVDENALSLRMPTGYLDEPFNRLFRSRSQPFRAGDRIYLGTLEALVTETRPPGDPVAVTFRFNWPLGSEKLRLVSWNGDRFVPALLPAPGARRVLEAVPPR